MKRILIIFLILIPILCSCSTLGKKVYYENADVIIYEPDSVEVMVTNNYLASYKASTNLIIKNKKRKTIILAFMYSINNGERELIYSMPTIEKYKMQPNETKKVSVEYKTDKTFESAFNEGYKNISILKESVVAIEEKELRDFVIEYKNEYNKTNKHKITSDPNSDDILSFVDRYLYNRSSSKIYTAEYLNEKFYSDSMFGLYCDVPKQWNRKIYDHKYFFSTPDIKFTVINLDVDRQNQSVLGIIDKHLINIVEKEYNSKLIVDGKSNPSVFRKDFSEYDSVLIKGHFFKDKVRTNVWIRYIERDTDSIVALLTEKENQQKYSKWELEYIILNSLSEWSHKDTINYKKG